MKKTPLYDLHVNLKAKLVNFGGYSMPIQYKGITIEHKCVRQDVGIFDVSHMGEFIVEGNESLDFLELICSNNISKIEIGKAQYNCFTNHEGGIVDDLIVYRTKKTKFMLVVNAANIEKDWNWMNENISDFDCNLIDISNETGMISVQGTKSMSLMSDVFDGNFSELKKFEHKSLLYNNDKIIVSNTGYTGSPGYEIYANNKITKSLWKKLLKVGGKYDILPIGLGARNTLRLEMGYCLYGNDINDLTTPFEANLMWITNLKKDFIGKEKILNSIETSSKKMINFKMIEKGIPRNGYDIKDEYGNKIGNVTSGTFSPSNKIGIGIGYLNTSFNIGDIIFISVREKPLKAEIVKLPISNG